MRLDPTPLDRMLPTAEATQDETRSLNSAPDAWRVEVFRRPLAGDPEGAALVASVGELGLAPPAEVRVAKGYLLAPGYAREAVEGIARRVLADPVVNEVRVLAPRSAPRPGAFQRILVMARPGEVSVTSGDPFRSASGERGA